MKEILVLAEEEQRSSGAIVKLLIQKIADLEQSRGIQIDWMGHLKDPEYAVRGFRKDYTSREVITAMGDALSAAGIPNNLYLIAERARP